MANVRSSKYLAWFFEGTYKDDERRRHLSALRKLQPHDDEVYEHDHLYACLSILDGKAIGLLTYDAIVLAATSLVLSVFPGNVTIGSVLVFIALLMSALSASLTLSVIWIFWTETTEFENAREVFTKLLDVRSRRTIAFRLGWIMSQLAMAFLVTGVILQRAL